MTEEIDEGPPERRSSPSTALALGVREVVRGPALYRLDRFEAVSGTNCGLQCCVNC